MTHNVQSRIVNARMKYYPLLLIAILGTLALVACSGDDDDDVSSDTPSAGPTTAAAYCADKFVQGTVDTWVQSITLLLAEEPDLTLEDEEGMRNAIEGATQTFCEVGQNPPPEAVDAYCNSIVAAIDTRLDGPDESRNAFLTEYYDTCNATDDQVTPSPAQ